MDGLDVGFMAGLDGGLDRWVFWMGSLGEFLSSPYGYDIYIYSLWLGFISGLDRWIFWMGWMLGSMLSRMLG